MRAKARSTTGCSDIWSITRSATARVRSSVVPGTIWIDMRLVSWLVGGKKEDGSCAKVTMVAMKASTPMPTVFQRFRRVQRRDRKSVVEGKRVSVGVDLGGGRIIKKKTQ